MYVWDDLRHFLAVARTGSLSRAARRLKVAPTTVSRRIDALEADLKAPLFIRSRSGWQLTDAGQRMLAPAEQAELAAVEVTRRVEEIRGTPSGTVRITTLDVLAEYLLAPAIPRLQARYPRIHLDLYCTPRRMDLRRGHADIALRIGRPRQGDLIARRLQTVPVHPYVSRSFLAARNLRAEEVTSLAGFPVIRLTREADWSGEKGPVVLALSVTSPSVQIAACAAGAGVAMMPDALAEDHPALVALPALNIAAELEVWLAIAPDVAPLPRVRAVADFLIAVFTRE